MKKGTKRRKSVRIIKRYSNRKLYDTTGSRYVTLEEIAEMVREGDEVSVIDNVTKEDLTALTLTQIILETERRRNIMPLQFLKNVISSGGLALRQYFQKSLPSAAAGFVEEAEKRVDRLLKKKELEEAVSYTIEDFQKFLNAQFNRIMQTVSSLSGLRGSLGILEKKLQQIEERIRRIEKPKEQPPPP